jgi:signal transduction histidine kinase
MHESFSPVSDGAKSRSGASPSETISAISITHDFRSMLQLASSSVRVAQRQLIERSNFNVAAMLSGALEALERANILAHRLSIPLEQRQDVAPLLIQMVLPELRTLLNRALGPDIRLESLFAADLPPIRCDRLEFENVLLNLATNARDAIAGSGAVLIQAVRCPSHQHQNCIELSMTDTGQGMPQEVAAEAFGAFFTTKPAGRGMGIGLFNVQSFVEGLGGSVELSSTQDRRQDLGQDRSQDRGTRVVLHLPATEETVIPGTRKVFE